MDISSSLMDSIKVIAKKYNLNLVILFGSQVTGRANKLSDTDIAVRASAVLKLEERISISYDIEKAFSSDMKKSNKNTFVDVEIVDIKSAPPLLLANIVHASILLYEEDEGIFCDFKISALNNYIDTAPLRAMLASKTNEIQKQLNESN